MKRVYYMFGLLALFGVVFGAAATLDVSGGAIQAGEDLNLKCDPDVVRVDGWGLETDDGKVYHVRIHDIHTDCVGNDIFVGVTNSGTVVRSGSAPIPADGTGDDDDADTGEVGVKIRFSGYPAVDITDIEVYIEGAFPKTP